MRAVAFAVLFAVLGLALGYGIYGRVGDEYVAPSVLFEGRKQGAEGILQAFSEALQGLEERRQKILIAGAVGGVVGLFFGALTGEQKGSKR